jgi:hypothetical protein
MLDEVTEKLMGIEANCKNCRYGMTLSGLLKCDDCPDYRDTTSDGRPKLRNWELYRKAEDSDENRRD